MAKKRIQTFEEAQRQSRKEILIARRQERQTRQIRLMVMGVAGLIVLIFAIMVILEFYVKPSQPVATVSGEEILLSEFQDRVKLRRAALILDVEGWADALGQDIGQVQQIAGQQITYLQDPVTLGQLVLDEMIDDVLIRQAAESRGIEVTDADVEQQLHENFNYFEGESPTAQPTATQTTMPTPSITPIPTQVITEVLPTNTPFATPTAGPTSTPRPTSTPVSLEAYQESYETTLDELRGLGVSETQFREDVRRRLYQERLLEALVAEQELSEEAEQVSFRYIRADDEDEIDEIQQRLASEDFLTVWNTIRSTPVEAESEQTSVATELIWRTQQSVLELFGEQVGEAAFGTPIDGISDILVQEGAGPEGGDRYFIMQVTGREIRPLTQSEIQEAKNGVLSSWLEGQRLGGVEVFERWRANVPSTPRLDVRFLAPPTVTPALPEIDITEVPPTPAG